MRPPFWYPTEVYGSFGNNATITPGNNTFGSWVEVIPNTEVLVPSCGMMIRLQSNAVSAAARDTLVNIGIDYAGGTSYQTVIPNLLASMAGTIAQGRQYYDFPILIPAGATVAAQASVNNATVGTLSAVIDLCNVPASPERFRQGTKCEAIGAVTASSRGTLVTPGASGALGAWTSLGTTVSELWWWQAKLGINDATCNARLLLLDIAFGDVTTKKMILEGVMMASTSAEQLMDIAPALNCVCEVPAGSTIYARISNSGANDAEYNVIAYGVGG